MTLEKYIVLNNTTRHKYNAMHSEMDDMHFHSKAEMNYYCTLKLKVRAGLLSYFLRQVPFHLPEGEKYICDFLLFYPDGKIEIIDVKGCITRDYSRKKKLVEKYYPVKIIEVYRRGGKFGQNLVLMKNQKKGAIENVTK